MTETDLQNDRIARSAEKTPIYRVTKTIGVGATVIAIVFAVLLAWRPISSNDIGYHLAYGDVFLDEGKLVDDATYVYTVFDPETLDKPENRPPGAWYDTVTQTYHFPNANYGSQIIMSLAYRAGGFMGLCLLQAALVLMMFVFAGLTMRRFGASGLLIGAGLLLLAMTSYERFSLRPEVFGYALLAAIFYAAMVKTYRHRTIVALVLLQWALVQVHSYWLLGLAIIYSVAGDAAVRCIWVRVIRHEKLDDALRRRLKRTILTALLMTLIVLINPWTWRLAALPFQTIAFLNENGIPPEDFGAKIHPWATIGEFFHPFHGLVYETRPTFAYIAVLALAMLGLIAAVLRRAWFAAALLAGFAVMSLSMRRNIASGALVMVPIALTQLRSGAEILRQRFSRKSEELHKPRRSTQIVRIASGIAIIVVGVFCSSQVISSEFYCKEYRAWRFGSGPTKRTIPIEMSQMLPKLSRDVNVFASYNVSSTVCYFSKGDGNPRSVPVLTNTWAQPASIMAENLRICNGQNPYRPFFETYDVGIVVLDCVRSSAPLARKLLADANWNPVHFDGKNVLFVRADLSVPDNIGEFRTADQWIADIRRTEPCPAASLFRIGSSLYLLGITGQAQSMWEATVETDPTHYKAWNQLGTIQADTGNIQRAKEMFEKALRYKSDYQPAQENLRKLRHKTQNPDAE